jgi:hypothetical protein
MQGLLNSFHEIRLADETLLDQGIVGAWIDGIIGRPLHSFYYMCPGRNTISVPVTPDRSNKEYRSIFVVHNEFHKEV